MRRHPPCASMPPACLASLGLLLGLWIMPAGAVADDGAALLLPETVERLDAERARLADEERTGDAEITSIRREASDVERRRQEALRGFAREQEAIESRARQAETEAARLGRERAEREAEIEHVLRAGGRWVSFTHDIAPILREKCVACHTPRDPGGGHVLTHHAALVADSGVGPAVVPGDLDSPLVTAVADGSMPKDGTPLSAAEVDLIRRWVALGGRLDGGADPTAPLVRIMPRVRQPDPPATYTAVVPVSAVAFSPDGTRLATSGYHEVLLWSVPEGRLLGRIVNVAERVQGLAFHPAGDRLAVAAGTPGRLGEAKLFAVTDSGADAGHLLADLGVADDTLLAVAFSPDGSRLAAAGSDATLRLFDTAGVHQSLERSDHADWVQAIAFSTDGTRLVSASRDKTAKVFDAATGRLHTTFTGHTDALQTICWLADGGRVATGGRDGAVRIWNPDDGKESRRIAGFAGPVTAICAVPEDRIAAGDRSGRIRLHAVKDGKQLAVWETVPAATTSLACTPDGRLIAVGSLDGSVTLLPLDGSGDPVRWLAAPGGLAGTR
jgi:hypothetical protein